MENFLVKADLHLHSRASSSQRAWYNRLFKCPESFTEPKEIYKKLKAMGMSFITITDHDTIEGVLEIAEFPEVFLSCEYTVSFPDEQAKVHVLVFGLKEDNHQDLMKLRENIYEFVKYLKDKALAYSLAHPLYSVEGTRITERLVEKMVLIFDNWEGINGTRGNGVRFLEEAIARYYEGWEIIERLADKYNIAPLREREKISFTAGSDDHGGLDVGRTWTAVQRAETIEEFLKEIREGRTQVRTERLGEERILKTLLRVSFEYSKGKNYLPLEVTFLLDHIFKSPDSTLVLNFLETFWGEKVSVSSFKEVLKNLPDLTMMKFWKNPSPKNLGELLLALATHFLSALIKYMQKREEERITQLAYRLGILNGSPPKIAYLVDTYPYVNGVTRSSEIIRTLSSKYHLPFYLFVCHSERLEAERLIKLKPILEIPTPFYEEMKLGIPNLLELLEFLENGGFTQIHIATPGPLGFLGLLAGKILKLKITSTYHTDLPTYAKIYTMDEEVENLVWKAMKLIIHLTDKFFVPSEYYKNLLISKGVEESKLRVFRRGVDTSVFSPLWKDSFYWQKTLGLRKDHKVVLYVGRVSREKNLDTFIYVAKNFPEIAFVIVGDGPYKKELEKEDIKNVYFLGYKTGEELSKIYASADVFFFPSETETYGLVVLEAMASGLPVIVSSKGAAQEHVIEGETGFIAQKPEEFSAILATLLSNPTLREKIGQKARQKALSLDLTESYLEYLHSIIKA